MVSLVEKRRQKFVLMFLYNTNNYKPITDITKTATVHKEPIIFS